MSVASKIPPLRFKGFEGEWDKKCFSDFAKVRRGLTYSPMDCAKHEIRVLRSSNIEDDKFVLHDDDVFVKKESANISSAEVGDILITAANGSSQLVGKHALIRGIAACTAVHGGFMLLATSTESVFLNAAMSAPWYRNTVASLMMGGNGALGNLCQDAFETMMFIAPQGKKERDQLGIIFRSLDALIADRESAVEKLQSLKKAMLEKMFPRAGAKVPEVRFKGCEGEWKEKRLGDSVRFAKGKGYSKSDIQEEGTPLFLYGRMYTDYQIEVDRVDTFCVQRNGSVLSVGNEVVCPASGETAEDIACASAVKEKGIVLGGDLNILVPHANSGLDPTFLAMSLTYGSGRAKIVERAQGKTVVHIHNSDLEDVVVLSPSLLEQRKIGAYFRSLDALISARQEEVGKLKNLKKALLDRMFV